MPKIRMCEACEIAPETRILVGPSGPYGACDSKDCEPFKEPFQNIKEKTK